MKTLLILRHAKSSWDEPHLSDHDRPLSKRGKLDAPRMGQLLCEEGLVPDLILSSTACRARATAKSVAGTCGYEKDIQFSRDLFHADVETYLWILEEIPEEAGCVMIVGHNPGMEELLDFLTGESEWLPTAALAQVELPIQCWRDIDEDVEGELIRIWRPRELT
jgi:phosphohistidine phosphatase